MHNIIFRDFLREIRKLPELKQISMGGLADAIGIGVSSFYGYTSNKPKLWCPEKKHDAIIAKFKELIGEDKVVYILDKYNMVQAVTLDENDIPSSKLPPDENDGDLIQVYGLSPMEQTLKMMELRHNSIVNNIEELLQELSSLKVEERTLGEAIDSLTKAHQYFNRS